MDRERPDPELLIKQISVDEAQKEARGTLKIFFGYAAGVGKTYAMLSAAHAAKEAGIDVVVGYVEPHLRPETQELLEGLEVLPTLQVSYKGIVLQELDLDAALKRKPKLILVDEMAHTNAKGCRHVKRYQDIQELLRHGIDVYTTVNVQHVESLNDVVEAITGVVVRERIPDTLFDSADHVELVDIEPEELLERLKKGKIYQQKQANKALGNFFVKENLAALREIALRRTADIVNKSVEKNKMLYQRSDYFTSEHILLCLSSSPSNAKVIRTAARLAEAFHGVLTALFVETSAMANMSDENKQRLNANVKLAEQLGAKIVTIEGDDVPYHVSEYAKVSGVSKIVIGRSGGSGFWLFRQPNFIDKLTELAPNLDIYVIPNQMQHVVATQPTQGESFSFSFSPIDTIKCIAILTVSTLIGFLFFSLGLSESNIIMAFMLGVLFVALSTTGLVYSGVYSLCSVLSFNYFFTDPRFSFQAYDRSYPVTFGIMLLTSGIISTLVKSIKQQKTLVAQKAYRTSLLLETSQKMQRAKDDDEILHETANQLMKLLDRTIIIYPVAEGMLGVPFVVEADSKSDDDYSYTSVDERAVAEWVFQNNHQAGAGTNTLPGAKCLYMTVRGNDMVLAVIAVATDGNQLDVFEQNLFISVLGECALALEKEIIKETKNKVMLQAQQESLRANLLRAISHDLRTPLTSISGNANLLLSNESLLSDEKKRNLYTDIYDDATWLINLVENILSVTRLDVGSVGLQMEPELLEDIIHEALQHIDRKSKEHVIKINIEDDMLMAKMDTHLIMQVIINIVDNAIKYTQPDSQITIVAYRKKDMVEVAISDDGDGISDVAKQKIFDMFFTVENVGADSRRGFGIGLSLCKSIIDAHGGEMRVEDNKPKGTIFYFTLPAVEVEVCTNH